MLLRDILDFLLPRTCAGCGQRLTTAEDCVCLRCLRTLHRVAYTGGDHHGTIERLFWGQIPVEHATSMFYYDSEMARSLIHSFKYHNRPEVARMLAEVFADELEPSGFFSGIDLIFALPLHPKKQRKRGYNQCDYIAEGLSRQTGIPVVKGVVERVVNNPSQTHLANALQRRDNVKDIFQLAQPDLAAGKHVLLVDDTLTTGATLLSCAKALAQSGCTISILTLAYANSLVDYQVV